MTGTKNGGVTYEALSAFADGEMDGGSGDFQARLADDPKARTLLEEISKVDDLVRASFGAEAVQPVPDHLVAAVCSGFRKRRTRFDRNVRRARWLPIAAAIIIAVTGLVGAFFVAEHRFEQRIAAYEERWNAGREALETALQEALENSTSGAELTFSANKDGISGHINPTRTYKSLSGHWCREFSEVIELSGTREFRTGLACREESGRWRRLETRVSGSAAIRLIR